MPQLLSILCLGNWLYAEEVVLELFSLLALPLGHQVCVLEFELTALVPWHKSALRVIVKVNGLIPCLFLASNQQFANVLEV